MIESEIVNHETSSKKVFKEVSLSWSPSLAMDYNGQRFLSGRPKKTNKKRKWIEKCVKLAAYVGHWDSFSTFWHSLIFFRQEWNSFERRDVCVACNSSVSHLSQSEAIDKKYSVFLLRKCMNERSFRSFFSMVSFLRRRRLTLTLASSGRKPLCESQVMASIAGGAHFWV